MQGAFAHYNIYNLPKSATLPKWAMLFLIRESQIQNNPIMHCFTWDNLLFVCGFWASNWLKFIMFWTHLEYLIYVTLIFETKQHALFSKEKKKEKERKRKTVKFEF